MIGASHSRATRFFVKTNTNAIRLTIRCYIKFGQTLGHVIVISCTSHMSSSTVGLLFYHTFDLPMRSQLEGKEGYHISRGVATILFQKNPAEDSALMRIMATPA